MKLTSTLGLNNQRTGCDLKLDLYDPDTQSRLRVEQFIHQVFAKAYNADLNQFLPRLMALHGKHDRVVAALGMREAVNGPLFLETYLDEPIEAAVSRLQGTSVARAQIMEVGNLASVQRGGLRQLIIALTSYLHGVGSEWVVFTAVPAVRKAFAAMDLTLHPLGVANKSRLNAGEQQHWGRYYDSGPVVVAGRVEDGYQRLRELLGLEKAMSLSCYLWQYAFVAGYMQRSIVSKPTTQPQDNLL
jgi:hypothetical protein